MSEDFDPTAEQERQIQEALDQEEYELGIEYDKQKAALDPERSGETEHLSAAIEKLREKYPDVLKSDTPQ